MVMDLIILGMLDFNVILGIDFLSKYRVETDARRRKLDSVRIIMTSSYLEKVKSLT